MEWSKAIGYARDVKLLLQPCCDRIEIAGSLRRLRSEVHDIEIVTKPKMDPFDQLQMRIADMVSHHRLYPDRKSVV